MSRLEAFAAHPMPGDLLERYRVAGLHVDAILPAALEATMLHQGHRVAVVDGDVHLTHRDLLRLSKAFAGGLAARGIGRGDAVAWQTPTWWESAVIAIGTWWVGAVNVPMLPIYRQSELRQILDDVRPKAVITPKTFRRYDHVELLEDCLGELGLAPDLRVVVRGEAAGWTGFTELIDGSRPMETYVRVDPDAPAGVAYTSGTTAGAKGVVQSSRTLMAETIQMTRAWGVTWQDGVFMPAPLAHLTGLIAGLTVPLLAGGKAVLLDIWDPERGVALIEREGATLSAGTPPFLEDMTHLYDAAGTRSSLRQFNVGGAAVPPTLIDRAAERGIGAWRCYGMTELLSVTIANRGYPADRRRLTDGPLAPGVEAQAMALDGSVLPLGEDGEIRVRGPERMLGYLKPEHNDEVMEPGGWLRTGDVGNVDEEGYLTITGRIKDIINRGGEKFSAREMEDLIATHPEVRAVAVVGAPHPRLGEEPAAFVVARRPDAPPSAEALVEYVRERGLAKQKTPVSWEFVRQLPATPFGKIKKQELLERLRGRGSQAQTPA